MPITAILFDLDGTLLNYDMTRDFLGPYLHALGTYMAHLIPPKMLADGIMAGSAAITQNDGTRTNAEAFANVFYPYIGRTRTDMEPRLMDFYTHEFPKLHTLTQRRPAARRVVQSAFDRGFDVVIATNPYFPEIATRHRMTWAGVDGLPYKKVTTYENSHFAKPNLGYYQEILDELDCLPENALVVGDENMDMVAANLGCPTFLVHSPATRGQTIQPTPIYQGPLEEVGTLLHQLAAPKT